MMTAWANFARSGSPGTVKGDPWAPFSSRAPHYMVLDSLGKHALRADVSSIDEILADVADTTLLDAHERCILAWELATALGDPSYGTYGVGMGESVHRRMCGLCAKRLKKRSKTSLVVLQYCDYGLLSSSANNGLSSRSHRGSWIMSGRHMCRPKANVADSDARLWRVE